MTIKLGHAGGGPANRFPASLGAPRRYPRLAEAAHRQAPPVAVLKFGSSVLRNDPLMSAMVSDIYLRIRQGYKVLAVVSAPPGTTDRLIGQARRQFDDPHPACLAALLATGECASAALLGMALDQAGISSATIDPGQAGFIAAGGFLEADPVALDDRKIHRLFRANDVVVLPGFYGRTAAGAIALLGRGGSDFSALFAAWRLGAEECSLVKDVDGLYPGDPNSGGRAASFSHLSWDQALELGSRAVQPKALRFAQARGLEFSVRAPLSQSGTRIGREPARRGGNPHRARPLRVALLGLGTVGMGVYHHLARHADRFELVGIAVRDRLKERHPAVPGGLLTEDPWVLLRQPADIVIELIGGSDPAAVLIAAALKAGAHVVTANKAVLARHGDALNELAARQGVRLSCSAAVGGAVPVLETVRRISGSARINGFSAVINGTCNFVLDRLADGLEIPDAVREARQLGYCEADPWADLSGADSADKLAMMAREIWGVRLDTQGAWCRGIEDLDSRQVRHARARGRVIRLVASCRKTARGIKAEVKSTELPERHFLAQASGSGNRVILKIEGRAPVLLSGRGAGRWPTSQAVLADLLDLHAQAPGTRAAGGWAGHFAEGRS